MLSRLSKPETPPTLFSTTSHFPIIFMATSLPPEALTKKSFPFNKTFSSVFAIQEFARKAVFRFFMKAYLMADSFSFSTFHPKNLFLTGLTLDPSREITEDELWYIWCLTVLYATKLILEKLDYTDFLFQDSQDPWEEFLPLSQHLHQFPKPTMDEPGPSAPGPSTQPSKKAPRASKVDKATQTSPKHHPRDNNCHYPPCRGPSCKHPKLSNPSCIMH